jgi:hypothetical protein
MSLYMIKQLNSFVIPPHFQHNRICKTSIMMRKNKNNNKKFFIILLLLDIARNYFNLF